MTAFMEGDKFCREVIVFIPEKELFEIIVDGLKKTNLELSDLGLEIDTKSLQVNIGFYKQGNIAASRKQLQPFVSDICKEISQ